ncbi:MAG: glycosyltransferase family 2 protein [Deltaproteobacteria bacterium]|nr:glycosyltransferase family 2 protein [Deltaproteobacteria bacterium]
MAHPSPLVSVVVPVLDEATVLPRLVEAVEEAAAPTGCRLELVLVNDGSTDGSGSVMDFLARENPHRRVVHLSRNFGHQAAIQAGLRVASGDAVVVMDADLQDDPAGLADMIARWREGYQVVYAIRVGRKEGLVKRALFHLFYRLLSSVSSTPIPCDAGNFGLLDRRVVTILDGLPEVRRYLPGLRAWTGFRQVGIPVERGERYDGRPRVSWLGLARLAQEAVFSFSAVPLTIFYAIAGIAILAFLSLAGFTLYHKLFTGLAIPGWTSIITTACFFGGLNALGIGILGEYVLRIWDQVRARPAWVVDRTVNVPENAWRRPGDG